MKEKIKKISWTIWLLASIGYFMYLMIDLAIVVYSLGYILHFIAIYLVLFLAAIWIILNHLRIEMLIAKTNLLKNSAERDQLLQELKNRGQLLNLFIGLRDAGIILDYDKILSGEVELENEEKKS